MNILICEDNPIQRQSLEKTISNYVLMENFDMRIACSSGNPEDILDFVANNRRTSLYFLDVDLNHRLNGIDLAAKIRQFDPHGIIVFTTTHAEMSHLTFKYRVEAMDYIIKEDDNFDQRVVACIHEAHQRILLSEDDLLPRFIKKIGDRIISIPYKEILYFESSQDHRIIVNTKQRRAEFYGKLKDLESIHPTMMRSHSAFVVNLENIESINSTTRTLHFNNGSHCVVSIRHLKKIKEALDSLNDTKNIG